jgi:hypothetical protein
LAASRMWERLRKWYYGLSMILHRVARLARLRAAVDESDRRKSTPSISSRVFNQMSPTYEATFLSISSTNLKLELFSVLTTPRGAEYYNLWIHVKY